MVLRWYKWFRSGADGLEVAQTVKKLCRWLRAGADGFEVVQMV